MKKKSKKKLSITKMKVSRLNETGDKKAQKATIPPYSFWCETNTIC
ncbi:MAG TPA: hypothetical protein VM802_18530 [Chitinophaga sp.]|nr:hypothetical protein [Chitinophaga sp.]HVI46883.1 hypothetical protein [Chitinophaga sp.]